MPADVETMAYAGEVPWHGMGVRKENAQTSEEMITAAGLDWEVAVGRLFGGPNVKGTKEYEDWKAIYRTSDGKPLGVCLGRFTPVQNREVFGFMDSLVDDAQLRYETAGALKGGRRVFMLAQLQGLGAEIAGDRYDSYLLGVNGHDNLMSLRVFPTFVRVVCSNTLQAALDSRGQNMHGGIMLRHVGNMEAKLKTAQAVLKITTESQRRLAKYLEVAAQTKATEAEVSLATTAIFGSLDEKAPKQREDAIQRFLEIYQQEEKRVGATAYALINAVTGYSDHIMKPRGKADDADGVARQQEARFASVLLDTGTASLFKAKGIGVVGDVFSLPKLKDISLDAAVAAVAAKEVDMPEMEPVGAGAGAVDSRLL